MGAELLGLKMSNSAWKTDVVGGAWVRARTIWTAWQAV
jgi:hypothetical protein